jgi:tetratricopeptide (TPR) repeat protein
VVILVFLLALLTALGAGAQAAPKYAWDGEAFAATPQQMLASAAQVKTNQYAKATLLLVEVSHEIEAPPAGRLTMRFVYRVEAQEALPYWGSIGAAWSPWRQERPQIRARVISPDGSVSELDPSVLSETTAHDQRPVLYEDQRVLSGPLPNVRPGAIVEQVIVQKDTAPASAHGYLHRILMGGPEPSLARRIRISAPEALPLHYELRNAPGVQVKREIKDGVQRLLFEQGPQDAEPEREHNLPADFETSSALDYSTGRSWNAVAAGYAADIAPAIQPQETAALLEGTQGLQGDALLRRLLTNLHRKVRYTGLEFGVAALVPHPTSETLRTGYGDCKDKAIALISALKALGIEARLALLDTRGGTDVSPALAGLGMFDHAIVYLPGSPAHWMDATAEFFAPGSLPWPDQGRWALIVDPATTTLVRTPINRPEENVKRSLRVYTLSEYGPARITETLTGVGAADAFFRNEYGQAASKEQREDLEKYVKDTYLSDSLDAFEPGTGADLTQPFQFRLTVAKARRGFSDMKTSVAALPARGLLWGYPDWALSDDGTEKPEVPGWKPRKNDAEFQPFVSEWEYRIVPPLGFEASTLPKNDEMEFGPGRLQRSYQMEKDGAVTVVWRFTSMQARMTPAELTALRKAVVAFGNQDMTVINFHHQAVALLAAGKPREALASYQKLAALHPNEALHHLQIALTLLEGGLGEPARAEVLRATELEPGNADAWDIRGYILQHDLVGRWLGSGFDREGSIAAYRKAIELDPKKWNYVADLAVLLEHNAFGERYAEGSDLAGAAALYRSLKDLSKKDAARYDNNLAYALLYGRNWAGTLELCATLARDAARNAICLAALAERDGAPAAIAEAQRRESEETARGKALGEAAVLLTRLRDYQLSLALLRATAAGTGSSDYLNRVQLMETARRYEEWLVPETDPRYPVQRLLLLELDPRAKPEDTFAFFEVPAADRKAALRELADTWQSTRHALRDAFPTAVRLDLIVSNFQFSVEGDDAGGYRVRATMFTGNTLNYYVVRRDGHYRVIGINTYCSRVGTEVLRLLEAGDLKGAKRWLDWVREKFWRGSSDDPLGSTTFTYFWTRGDDPDPLRMKLAAYVLQVSNIAGVTHLAEVQALRAQASGEQAVYLELLLTRSAWLARDWKVLGESAARLFAARPTSDEALRMLRLAALDGNNPDLAEKAALARLERLPDDLPGARLFATAAEIRGDFVTARARLRPLLDSNRAEVSDYNSYTWYALFTDHVTEDDIALLQKAMARQPHNTSYILHTLACLYAEMGRTKEARERLLESMSAAGMHEPDESIWFGFGRIAEQYGLYDAATALYRRVSDQEKAFMDGPASTYNLARRREAVIARLSAGSTSTGK